MQSVADTEYREVATKCSSMARNAPADLCSEGLSKEAWKFRQNASRNCIKSLVMDRVFRKNEKENIKIGFGFAMDEKNGNNHDDA